MRRLVGVASLGVRVEVVGGAKGVAGRCVGDVGAGVVEGECVDTKSVGAEDVVAGVAQEADQVEVAILLVDDARTRIGLAAAQKTLVPVGRMHDTAAAAFGAEAAVAAGTNILHTVVAGAAGVDHSTLHILAVAVALEEAGTSRNRISAVAPDLDHIAPADVGAEAETGVAEAVANSILHTLIEPASPGLVADV